MKELLSKIVAAVIAGLILVYLTQRYFLKSGQNETKPSQQTEIIVPNKLNQRAEPPQNQVGTPLSHESPQPFTKKQITSENQKQNVLNSEVAPPKAEEPQQQASDSRKVETQLQIMIKETRAKQNSLSKDSKMNTEMKKVQKKAEDVSNELESQ